MKSQVVTSCISGLTAIHVFFLSCELPRAVAEVRAKPAKMLDIPKDALQVGSLVAGPRLAGDQLKALSAIVFEARYVTGKDLRVLNSFFHHQPNGVKAIRNQKALATSNERDIYLIIRAFVREATPFPVMGIAVCRFPVDDVIPLFGDPVEIDFMRSTQNHVYAVKHVVARHEGKAEGYRNALLKTRHKFAVVGLAFK